MNWKETYLRLADDVAIKVLEQPYLYSLSHDELYEINDEAKDFLEQCDGTSLGKELTDNAEFVEYCLTENLLEASDSPSPIKVPIVYGLNPSLRYLELNLLHKCNLRCAHCYLGEQDQKELPLASAIQITEQFAALGGLRLVITGGEPLLYKKLPEFLDTIAPLKLRRVLFSNGTLINDRTIKELNVDEIQFSLDGWEEGHNRLREAATFKKTVDAIYLAKANGIDVSIATMVHSYNLDQFDRLQSFVEEIEATDWGIDIMTVTGNLAAHQDFAVPYETAAPFLDYGYGGGYHGSSEGYACGRHVLAVLPDGSAVKCTFYQDSLGNAVEDLKQCWLNAKHIPLNDLTECQKCPALADCKGGCRFRAKTPLGRDPFMCIAYGIDAPE